MLLAQRVQHIKRLRKARREDIVETEWYNPKQPNREWRNAFDPQQQAPAAADDGAAPPKKAVAGMVVDEVMEMIEFKAERCVRASEFGLMGGLDLGQMQKLTPML